MVILRRYSGQETFIDKNGNSVSRRYKRLDKNSTIMSEITTDSMTTLDILSMRKYGTPLMFWLIADANDIIDPMVTIPAGTKLKIPVI